VAVTAGVQGSVELVVGNLDTACALHSGEVEVLATPRLISLCEEAAIVALAQRLSPGQTSVGSRVELTHLAPTRVGSTVRASATLERVEGRRLIFSVSVMDRCGLVAAGKITRVVVDKAAFLENAR
jgi:predicted thioesterase